ncbi:DUF410-domain-containing protein [Suhomyces tanzawaensis NRRL Y-17324]|uniref:DUF410-domain-containing protein n=1 Tax=Suhomyces tanzawaensis NRRL Y-17324 TaxID=984487 RepID=A0A1E4SHZ8_9ASCO|nr:DUF410-domain-containing protein [Suhomyces tanzawaensis NRRL Y-17324]ODV79131.1 DUF410-domain-containing protein [Suhomyces tanzawaensis NRRL Y-17324]
MSDKLQRTIQRFQAKIDSGSFYEAHQTLRTITNRYVKSKQYSEAVEILYQGSVILGKNKESSSASDLIQYMIEVTKEGDLFDKVKLIDSMSYLPDNEPALVDLAKQISQASSSKYGDADMHHFFGNKLLNAVKQGETKVFPLAEVHLVLGTYESVPLYTDFLYEWWAANGGDPGVFLARGVINYAYLKNVKFAREVGDRFINRLIKDGKINQDQKVTEGDVSVYVGDYPLFTFLQLLLLTLTKDASKFTKLFDQYKQALQRNNLVGPIEHLGKLYFNLKGPAQAPNMLSFMGDLFK